MQTDLNGKTVIVTGASGGIGQTVARDFAAEGCRVALHFHRNQATASQLAGELADALPVQADLRDESQVQQMFAQVEAELGPPQILVANAGLWPSDDTPVWQKSLAEWNDTLAANQTSAFLCVREFLSGCKRHKMIDPSIVLIGSTAGDVGEAGHADYAAAKSGIMGGFLNSLKNEIPRLARRGRVNCVCPGWTLTPMAEKFTGNEAAMVRALQTIPLRKFGRPQDVSSAIMFLASNRLAGHITGQCLFVSGGMEGRVLYQAEEVDLDQAIS